MHDIEILIVGESIIKDLIDGESIDKEEVEHEIK
jgi:hypothetical protein